MKKRKVRKPKELFLKAENCPHCNGSAYFSAKIGTITKKEIKTFHAWLTKAIKYLEQEK